MNNIERKLDQFFLSLSVKKLESFSPLANDSFPGDFNVSGFHKEVNSLVETPSAFWGIDRCLRAQEKADEQHSYLFHMLVYAKSADLNHNFTDPFTDERFFSFQKDIIDTFIHFLKRFRIDPASLEATYYAGGEVGSYGGRDKLLESARHFPADSQSKRLLEDFGLKTIPIYTLDNIDIRSIDGALVGPRVEVSYQGVELATLVFDCFQIKDSQLAPINYVGGFAVGVERLETLLQHTNDFLDAIPRYNSAKKELASASTAPISKIREYIFSKEALDEIANVSALSKGQKELFRQLRKKFNDTKIELEAL